MFRLFFPRTCAVCGRVMAEGEYFLCTRCRWEMPMTGYVRLEENPMQQRLYTMMGIRRAGALFFYSPGSGYDALIRRFKYGGYARLSYELGRWLGHEVRRSGLYDDVDVIVPVPLHPFRLLKRGYNQAGQIGAGIKRETGISLSTGNLYRNRHNPSQTNRDEKQRWENVDGIFSIRYPERFTGKHILLVDDVLTTGATLEACADVIRKHAPDCQISIVTLAATSRDGFV